MEAPRTDRATIALILVAVWFAGCAIAAGFSLGGLWDLRSFELDPMDSAWRFELSWLGTQGSWSGRDFQYPRGPLWQAVGAMAAWLAGGEWGGTLGVLHVLFALSTLGLVIWIVVRHVPSRWGRVVALFALALLTNTAGVATFRAFLPAVAILAYLPAEGDAARPWRSAFAAGAVTVLAGLVSFDRFGMIGLSLAALALVDLALRWWWRREPGQAVLRGLRYLVALLACAAAAQLLLWPLGFDLWDYVAGQRALMADYVVNMSVGWEVSIPMANIRALFALLVALVLVGAHRRAQPDDRSHVERAWLAGALPAVLFASIRSDEGHMIIAMTPALVVLVIVAAGASAASWSRRTTLGVVAAVAIVGWLGVYPRAIAGHPDALLKAYRIAVGQTGPDLEYRTDLGAARRFVEAHRGEMSCLATSADLSVLHAVTGVRGPTELSLRWSADLKRALAARIADAECEYFLYSVRNFDEPGHSWPFGADFLEVARRYELYERIGGRVVAMRRRDAPRVIATDALASRSRALELPVPGRVALPLGEELTGTDLLRLELRLEMDVWRSYVGSTPRLDWRFETEDGRGVTPWRRLFHLTLGRDSAVWVSADPEAAEWRWITGREPHRRRRPTRLVFRAAPRGVVPPSSVRIEVRSIARVPPPNPAAPRGGVCEGEVDLLEPLRREEAFARWVAPNPSDRHFHLEPQPPNTPLAEVLFEVTPCEETCFFAQVAVRGSPERSDGVIFDLNVIDAERRPRVHRVHVPPGGDEVPVEVSLARWAARPVLLRLGTLYGETRAHDDAIVVTPRLGRCSARGSLGQALADSTAVVARGSAGARDEGHVDVGPTGAELRWPIATVQGTCMAFRAAPAGAGPGVMRLTWRVAEGDVEHVLWEGEIAAGQEEIAIEERALFDWTDRRVEIVWDIAPVEGQPPIPIILRDARGYTCGQG